MTKIYRQDKTTFQCINMWKNIGRKKIYKITLLEFITSDNKIPYNMIKVKKKRNTTYDEFINLRLHNGKYVCEVSDQFGFFHH